MENIEYKGFNIRIEQDENLESPRNWDNLGKMICWHKRYTLGDEKLLEQYSEKKECRLKNIHEYCNSWDEVEEVLKIEFKAIVILPLYLYDHSGISMKTFRHGIHSSWDCGMVGFIYITKEDIYKEFSVKKISKKLLEQVTKNLEGEVETYNQYLIGDVYGFIVEDLEENEIDSCWGFYGEEYAIKEAKSIVDWTVEDNAKKAEQLKHDMPLIMA